MKDTGSLSFFANARKSLLKVFRSKYFYLGLLALIMGEQLNFASETYLHEYMDQGKSLPMLSDLILDNLPYMRVSVLYDIFCIFPVAFLIIYIFHRGDYNRIPFFLLMIGIFYMIRGVFIVLTPFGNPPMFEGTESIFRGFSKYELGVYPSGHAGNVFMIFLLVRDSIYKKLILFCLIVVIMSLFLSRGHYSIDILSGLFFSYAIKSFGEKHLSAFDLGKHRE
ncbi:MAG TPA: phosphatase PAP2-related protein [Bacteroidales bacterium]|nr:phosphatase PAP2-related protein [Bacteroidales bacterium]